MFRYKANLASKSLSEEHSKITRLSSSDSTSSKEGMDPGQDSWVFSKASPSMRKQRDLDRRREDPVSGPDNDEDTYSVTGGRPPIDENMKVNVLYRGMVYRIRGIKIICSILAGVILLLAAVVILGIWIILGASDDGRFYFPWSGPTTESPVNKSIATHSLDYNSKLTNLTKIAGVVASLEPDVRLPPDPRERPDEYASYQLPSEEVGEAIGHMQAVHPRPTQSTASPEAEVTAIYSGPTAHDDYYDDYDEYYVIDGDVEYSLHNPVTVDAPTHFSQNEPSNYGSDEVIVPGENGNNFRVHIGEYEGENERIFSRHLVKPEELTTAELRSDESIVFRPSPRIPDQLPDPPASNQRYDHRSGSRAIDPGQPEVQEYSSVTKEQRPPVRPFTNAHITRDEMAYKQYTEAEHRANKQYPEGERMANKQHPEGERMANKPYPEGERMANKQYSEGERMADKQQPEGERMANKQHPEGGRMADKQPPGAEPMYQSYEYTHSPEYRDETEEPVVEYGEILIAREPHDSMVYYDEIIEDYQPDESYPDGTTASSVEKSKEPDVISDPYKADSDVRGEMVSPQYPDTFIKISEPEGIEDDPHRRLFTGQYDSSQIILSEEPMKPNIHDDRIRMPFNSDEYPLQPFARHPGRLRNTEGLPMSMNPRFPPHHIARSQQKMLSQQRIQSMRPPPPPPPQKMHPERRRPVPGTVHPIPNIRRSHITAGFRPRISSANVDFLRRRDYQSSQIPSRAEQYADSVIAESITYPTVVRSDGSPVNRNRIIPISSSHPQHNARFPQRSGPDQQRFPPSRSQQPKRNDQERSSFIGSLRRMYDYSSRIASSLLSFPEKSDLAIANTTSDFLQNSFGFLSNYNGVFKSLPQAILEPLKQFKFPSADQVENLNPFELSLMTWTFIDFWEFLIEKVGTLSKEDLQILEMRLERIREQKDKSMARAFIQSIPRSAKSTGNETLDEDIEIVVKTFELSLLDEQDNLLTVEEVTNSDSNDPITELAPENDATESTIISKDGPNEITQHLVEQGRSNWDVLGIFTSDERKEFMEYAVKTLFNFGKVYLRTDYALDCMMLLFCKDINANTKNGGMDGIAARLKSVGLKVLTDKEGRQTDTVTGVWQALTQWAPLDCDIMFPKCDGSKALEIVNEVANASRK